MELDLIRKYNVQGPRYTSYPAVPHWKNNISESRWVDRVTTVFRASNKAHGISVYIHLPYCESLCTYCGCNTRITVNHAVERPYILGVLAEWHAYIQLFGDERPVIAELHLGGGTPTFFSPENLQFLISELLAPCDVAPQAEFGFEGHPNNTTFEHLRVLRNLGFTRLSLGIQDFDPQVQKAINRIQPVDMIERLVGDIRARAFGSLNFDLIYGLPKQTLKSVEDTLREVIRLAPDRISYYNYAHLPERFAAQRAIHTEDLPPPGVKLEMLTLVIRTLTDAGYLYLGMDHFVKMDDPLAIAQANGTLCRNFQGYSIHKAEDLVGLGVSSISNIHGMFVQNAAQLNTYYQALDENRLPVVKGRESTQEDVLRRDIIQQLSCYRFLDIARIEREYGIDFEEHFNLLLPELEQLERDGLLSLATPGKLFVSAEGSLLLRNICMVFDEYLRQDTPSKPTFSRVI